MNKYCDHTTRMQGKRVQLQLQLFSYSNPQRQVAGGLQCYDTGTVPNINPSETIICVVL